MPKIEANGLGINYLEFGAGNEGTPVLLVHGLGAQAKWMEPLATYLVDNYGRHVFAIDLAGFGGSDKREDHPDTDQSYSVASYVKDIVAWMDAVGLEKTIMLGHSMGGIIAQLFAKDHADRLEKLILLNADTYFSHSGMEQFLVKNMPFGAVLKTALQRSHPVDCPKETLDKDVKEAIATVNRKIYVKCFVQNLKKSIDTTPWLPSISVPTLVFGSEADRVLRFASAKLIADTIPGATLHVIKNGCHEAQLFHTQEVGQAIGEFI
jgi:pimeloyl-ACP methyl ester carboxylesterase